MLLTHLLCEWLDSFEAWLDEERLQSVMTASAAGLRMTHENSVLPRIKEHGQHVDGVGHVEVLQLSQCFVDVHEYRSPIAQFSREYLAARQATLPQVNGLDELEAHLLRRRQLLKIFYEAVNWVDLTNRLAQHLQQV